MFAIDVTRNLEATNRGPHESWNRSARVIQELVRLQPQRCGSFE